MGSLSEEMTTARETTLALLEQLGLEAFLFDLEPRDEQWQITVECALGEGWARITLEVPRDHLKAAGNETRERGRLLEAWRQKLNECKAGHVNPPAR